MNAVLILITETDCKESSGTYCIQAPVVTDTVCYGRVGTLIEVFRRKLQSCLAADAVDRVVVQLNRALNQDSDTHCIEAVGGHRLRRCAWEEELPLVGARATGKGPDPGRASHVPLQADRCSTRCGVDVDGGFRLEVNAGDNAEDELRAGEGCRHLLGGGAESAAVLVLAQSRSTRSLLSCQVFYISWPSHVQTGNRIRIETRVRVGSDQNVKPKWTVQDAKSLQEGADHELPAKQLSERTPESEGQQDSVSGIFVAGAAA